jgi:uncharacterized protein YceH (UPF0502 family)
MLSFEEGRVLAVLIEKLLTTPEQVPLSVNACMLGCNQKTNRDPVVQFSESEVMTNLEKLQSNGYVLHCTGAGSRVEKYTQNLDRVMELKREDICLLSILILRGPQTPGELSTRSKRGWPEGSLTIIEAKLNELSSRETPLVQRLERMPGQKESRWMQLLVESQNPAQTSEAQFEMEVPASSDLKSEELLALKDEVEFLRDEVAELRNLVEQLQIKVEG